MVYNTQLSGWENTDITILRFGTSSIVTHFFLSYEDVVVILFYFRGTQTAGAGCVGGEAETVYAVLPLCQVPGGRGLQARVAINPHSRAVKADFTERTQNSARLVKAGSTGIGLT